MPVRGGYPMNFGRLGQNRLPILIELLNFAMRPSAAPVFALSSCLPYYAVCTAYFRKAQGVLSTCPLFGKVHLAVVESSWRVVRNIGGILTRLRCHRTLR
jgi:hypothetical protein